MCVLGGGLGVEHLFWFTDIPQREGFRWPARGRGQGQGHCVSPLPLCWAPGVWGPSRRPHSSLLPSLSTGFIKLLSIGGLFIGHLKPQHGNKQTPDTQIAQRNALLPVRGPP